MKVRLKPANIITVKIKVYKTGNYNQSRITIPPEIVERNNLRNNDQIVIAYLCKADENIEESPAESEKS